MASHPEKIRVLVVFGGRSGEHAVSQASAASVVRNLDASRYDVTLLGITQDGEWRPGTPAALQAFREQPKLEQLSIPDVRNEDVRGLLPLRAGSGAVSERSQTGLPDPPSSMSPDVVFPVLHGTYGEDGTMQGLLDLLDLPFVGSGVLGSAVGMDKDVAKRLAEQAGIPVVPYRVLRLREWQRLNDAARKACVQEYVTALGLPCFVKPCNAGSSLGVHKVKSTADFVAAVDDCFSYDTKILIEQGIAARELEVSVLEGRGLADPRTSVVGEIIPHHEFYSYEAKYLDENGAGLKIPADVPAHVADEVRVLAVKTFQVLELEGLARADFFLDRDSGKIYLNEVNTLPGFTKISMYPKLWEATGLPYSKLLDELISLAMERHAVRAKRKLKRD